MEEKRQLIEAINEIRKELSLEPYPSGYLESKDVEELKKLYSAYFRMREDYWKKLEKEKPRFKLNLKTGLLIGIPLILVVSLLLSTQFISKFFEGLSPSLITTKEGTEREATLNFILTFGYVMQDAPVFILHNKGDVNITSFNVTVDEVEKEYQIVSGSLPLEPYKTLYFLIRGLCDNKSHVIKVIGDSVQANFTLTNECETGSRVE